MRQRCMGKETTAYGFGNSVYGMKKKSGVNGQW